MSHVGLQGRRIAIIGCTGAGKSTLARALSARLHIPHVELDALNWQPGWRSLALEEPDRWALVVANAIAQEAWITDGNYSQGALGQILPRASDVIWLDYSRALIMARVVRRSFLRAISGRELWPGTGNREEFRKWLEKDHPIRWAWDTYRNGNERREIQLSGSAVTHAENHRFRSPRETQLWLAHITQ